MFKDLEEFVHRKYGDKQLTKQEIQNIFIKAVELKIIPLPPTHLFAFSKTSDVLNYIKHLENREKETNKSKQTSEMSNNTQHQLKVPEDSSKKVSVEVPQTNKKPENLIKLEKVLDAFLKYEQQRINKKTYYLRYILLLIIVFIIITLFIYFNYIPEPY